MGRGHYQLARHLLAGKKPAEAVQEAERSAALYRKALQTTPESDPVRLMLVDDEVIRTLALIDAGRLADARSRCRANPRQTALITRMPTFTRPRCWSNAQMPPLAARKDNDLPTSVGSVLSRSSATRCVAS